MNPTTNQPDHNPTKSRRAEKAYARTDLLERRHQLMETMEQYIRQLSRGISGSVMAFVCPRSSGRHLLVGVPGSIEATS